MELMQRPQFEQLPDEARQQLLECCGSVLGTLGQAMQEQTMISVPSLVGGAKSTATLTESPVHPAAKVPLVSEVRQAFPKSSEQADGHHAGISHPESEFKRASRGRW